MKFRYTQETGVIPDYLALLIEKRVAEQLQVRHSEVSDALRIQNEESVVMTLPGTQGYSNERCFGLTVSFGSGNLPMCRIYRALQSVLADINFVFEPHRRLSIFPEAVSNDGEEAA